MKKLMIAASAVAVGLAAFADVYNVKFTTTTIVDADGVKTGSKKVKGETEEYYKKTSVTVNGVVDYADGKINKYYFWTGSGKKLAPIPNAVFEITNETDMDSNVSGKNYAVNVGFYVGDEADMQSCFISGGLGKVKTAGAKDFDSFSGSFGGTWCHYAAYGTWSWSKNSSATKKGIEEYVNSQGKSAGVTIAAWNVDNTAFQENIDSWRDYDTAIAESAAQIAEIAELVGINTELQADLDTANSTITTLERVSDTLKKLVATYEGEVNRLTDENADQAQTIDALEKASATLKKLIAAYEGEVDRLTDENASLTDTVAGMKEALAQLDNAAEVVKVIGKYLQDQIDTNQAMVDDLATKIEDFETLVADYYASKDGSLKDRVEAEFEAAQAAYDAAEEAYDAASDTAYWEDQKYLEYDAVKQALLTTGLQTYETYNEGEQAYWQSESSDADLNLETDLNNIQATLDAEIAAITAKSADAANFGLDYLVYYIENGVNDTGDTTVYPADLATIPDAEAEVQAVQDDIDNIYKPNLEAAQADFDSVTTAEGEPDLDALYAIYFPGDPRTYERDEQAKLYWKNDYKDVLDLAKKDLSDAEHELGLKKEALDMVQQNLESIKAFRDEAKAAYAEGKPDSYAQNLIDEATRLANEDKEAAFIHWGEIKEDCEKWLAFYKEMLDWARNQSKTSVVPAVDAQEQVRDDALDAEAAALDVFLEADEALNAVPPYGEGAKWKKDEYATYIANIESDLQYVLEVGLGHAVDMSKPAEVAQAIEDYRAKLTEAKASAQRNVDAATELKEALEKTLE